jgi:hypothetical protein
MAAPKQTAQTPVQEQPAQVVTIGTMDGPALLVRHGASLAIKGRTDPMGLSSIVRPADVTIQ